MKEFTITQRTPNNHYKLRVHKVQVDDADYDMIKDYRWCIRNDRPTTRIGKTYVGIHRLIMGIQTGDPTIVDHIDGNPFNNQRSNLRLANRFQNQQNRKTNEKNTLPKGIRKLPSGRYNVRVQTYNERLIVGTFDTLDEAIEARNRVAKAKHGEFYNPAYKLENGKTKSKGE